MILLYNSSRLTNPPKLFSFSTSIPSSSFSLQAIRIPSPTLDTPVLQPSASLPFHPSPAVLRTSASEERGIETARCELGPPEAMGRKVSVVGWIGGTRTRWPGVLEEEARKAMGGGAQVSSYARSPRRENSLELDWLSATVLRGAIDMRCSGSSEPVVALILSTATLNEQGKVS